MATENPTIEGTGTGVASGPADVTVNPSKDVAWCIGATLAEVAELNQRHMFYANEDRSMRLQAGETLFLFGSANVAVTVSLVT